MFRESWDGDIAPTCTAGVAAFPWPLALQRITRRILKHLMHIMATIGAHRDHGVDSSNGPSEQVRSEEARWLAWKQD